MANQNSNPQNPSKPQGSRDLQHEGRADPNRNQQQPSNANRNLDQDQVERGGTRNRTNPQRQSDQR